MTFDEYTELLAKAQVLIAVDPAPDSLYGKRLLQMTALLEEYEREHYPRMFGQKGSKADDRSGVGDLPGVRHPS